LTATFVKTAQNPGPSLMRSLKNSKELCLEADDLHKPSRKAEHQNYPLTPGLASLLWASEVIPA
jgi:hypothetical protein